MKKPKVPSTMISTQALLDKMRLPGSSRPASLRTLFYHISILKSLGIFGEGPRKIKLGAGPGTNHFTQKQADLILTKFKEKHWRKFASQN